MQVLVKDLIPGDVVLISGQEAEYIGEDVNKSIPTNFGMFLLNKHMG